MRERKITSSLPFKKREVATKLVDKIVVIDSGNIKEIGSHKDLLKRNGFYNKLYEMQYKNTAY